MASKTGQVARLRSDEDAVFVRGNHDSNFHGGNLVPTAGLSIGCDSSPRGRGCRRSSFERGDRQKRLLLPGAIPVVAKLLQMKRAPLVDKIVGGSRQVPFVNRPGLDFDHRLVSSVKCLEVRRRMIAIVETNDDAVKPADLRQALDPSWVAG